MQTISNENVLALIKAKMPEAEVQVDGDGYQYRVTIISDQFVSQPTVKRHKMIYAALNDVIARGELHALILKTHTPEEWRNLNR